MKKLLLTVAVTGIAALAIMAKSSKSDPVVMTIDNHDVKLSEFEYLYNKNNNQQLTPLTFDEYVDLFVNYKLKVADALNAKLDTTSEFRTEYEKFRRDLAQPYLRDNEVAEALVKEAYDHAKEEIYVSHVMVPLQDERSAQILDSLRTAIINGETTFEEVARNYSIDRASSTNDGHMGWVTGNGQYPWPFEKAAFDTPVGEISEVINSGMGYHIVKPETRRDARGELLVSHILLLTQGLDEEAAEAQKVKIDSLYDVIAVKGEKFAEVAKRYSEDGASARNGGSLDWFGSGRMVAEFDSVSFALAVDEMSKPFKTRFGWHIVLKHNQRGVKSLEEMRPAIEKAIEGDARAKEPVQAMLDKTAAATKSTIYPEYKEVVKSLISANDNNVDSVLFVQLKESTTPAYTAIGKTVTLGEAIAKMQLRPSITPENLMAAIDRCVTGVYNNALTNYMIDQLEENEPNYSNLINEYRDGILLFDISSQKVWDRAARDTEGIKKYFDEHKDKYQTWEAPKYKAYILFANNDSTLTEIVDYAKANFGGQKITDIDQEAFTKSLKDKFGKNVRVERIIAAQGDNPITDYLGFGAEKPDAKGSSWSSYEAFAGETINQPEEVNDCKGAVISDYQSQLEQEWIKQLHDQYAVKINKKALEKAKNL